MGHRIVAVAVMATVATVMEVGQAAVGQMAICRHGGSTSSGWPSGGRANKGCMSTAFTCSPATDGHVLWQAMPTGGHTTKLPGPLVGQMEQHWPVGPMCGIPALGVFALALVKWDGLEPCFSTLLILWAPSSPLNKLPLLLIHNASVVHQLRITGLDDL